MYQGLYKSVIFVLIIFEKHKISAANRAGVKLRIMTKIIVSSFLVCTVLLMFGCKGKEESVDKTAVEEDFYEFQNFSLKDYGLKATIMLPDETANIGASMRPEVKHDEEGFKWEIEVGPNFNLIIDDFGEERNKVGDKKKSLQALDIFETKFLVDEKILSFTKVP